MPALNHNMLKGAIAPRATCDGYSKRLSKPSPDRRQWYVNCSPRGQIGGRAQEGAGGDDDGQATSSVTDVLHERQGAAGAGQGKRFEVGVGPSVVVMDEGMAKNVTTTTMKGRFDPRHRRHIAV
jgi:hypothetical protein